MLEDRVHRGVGIGDRGLGHKRRADNGIAARKLPAFDSPLRAALCPRYIGFEPVSAAVIRIFRLRKPGTSAAQSDRSMRDPFGGDDEVGEAHPLIGCWPFPVDADVARTVLHGRDTEHLLDDVAVTDVAKAPMRANHSRSP
jgi:hypothetical protein